MQTGYDILSAFIEKQVEYCLRALRVCPDIDVSVQSSGDLTCLKKANPAALNPLRIGSSPKAVEDIGKLLIVQCISFVFHGKVIALLLTDVHLDSLAIAIFYGIFHKLRQDPADAILITSDQSIMADLKGMGNL